MTSPHVAYAIIMRAVSLTGGWGTISDFLID